MTWFEIINFLPYLYQVLSREKLVREIENVFNKNKENRKQKERKENKESKECWLKKMKIRKTIKFGQSKGYP